MIEVRTYCPKDYFGSNCYLIKSGDFYSVVDPSVDYSIVKAEHPEIEGRIKYILLTHCHFDHIFKIDSWVENSQAKVIIGANDASGLSNSYTNCYLQFLGVDDGYYGEYLSVSENTRLEFGDSFIEVIDCPGHTAGGVSYRIDGCLFTGDTVFAQGGYGRCDLPGGDTDVLEKTLFKIFSKEKDEIFYPGHGEKTTLKETLMYFM